MHCTVRVPQDGAGKNERVVNVINIIAYNPRFSWTSHAKDVVKELVEKCRDDHKARLHNKTIIKYSQAEQYNPRWLEWGARDKRSMDSVHLPQVPSARARGTRPASCANRLVRVWSG